MFLSEVNSRHPYWALPQSSLTLCVILVILVPESCPRYLLSILKSISKPQPRCHVCRAKFFYQPRSGRSTFDVGKKTGNVSFFCHFCLCAWNIFNWCHYMAVYGLAQTPAIIFETIWTPGPNFGSNGPLAPNSKKCNFLIKPHNMGIYRLTWTPVFIFWVIWTLWSNFGSKGPLAPN